MPKKKQIWYALKCNGVYKPFLYACDDYLDKKLIRSSKESCVNLCRKLNGEQEKKCDVVECVELTKQEQHKYKTVVSEYEIQSKTVLNDVWCCVVIRVFYRLYSDNSKLYVVYKDSDEKEHPGQPIRDELFSSESKKTCMDSFNEIVQDYGLVEFVNHLSEIERLTIPSTFMKTINKLKKEAVELRKNTRQKLWTYVINKTKQECERT